MINNTSIIFAIISGSIAIGIPIITVVLLDIRKKVVFKPMLFVFLAFIFISQLLVNGIVLLLSIND
ncbi:hypothetical protein [Rummeliibacillus pycnus]|uniref:hypothetical protein n=1 Tax=Rummeliibacillus pycnus TaxID=101070 RepID=UPI003D2AB846